MLSELYAARGLSEEPDLFVQPIVIMQASICEACIYDLIETRIRRHKWEPIQSIREDVVQALRRARHQDSFKKIINIARSHNLLGNDQVFYDDLHWVRKARNRIHLQGLHNDNDFYFDSDVLGKSEMVVEQLLKKLPAMYPRDEAYQAYVRNFEIPWDEQVA